MKFFLKLTFALSLTVAALFAAVAEAHEYKAGDLVIKHPWSRATVATAPVAGGYLSITNTGTQDDTLLSVSSEISDTVQLHEMSMDKDVMKMGELKGGIAIPAGKTIVLAPMGKHVMFVKIKSHPKKGETFKGILTFAKAGNVPVDFKVEAADAVMDMKM